jgi:hypothetical protein
MKVNIELDIPLQEIANLIGVKSKSYVHKMLKNGKGEQVGELLVNAWRTQGEQHQNVRVVKINILDPKKVNAWRTQGEQSGELLVNAKEEARETKETKERIERQKAIENVPPAPPLRDYKDNKDKKENKEKKEVQEEKNISPFGLYSLQNKVSPQGECETTKTDQCFTEQKKRTSTAFYPPTIAEVQDYIDTKGYHVDAEYFCAFYESKGWYVGKNKMKNWRMAVVTWEKQNKNKQNSSYNYGTGYNRTNPWSNRRPAPVIASSAKDYEGRF